MLTLKKRTETEQSHCCEDIDYVVSVNFAQVYIHVDLDQFI